MFYSHEGKLQTETVAQNDLTNTHSAHVAEIRCGNRVVCCKGVQSLLPCTDRSGRLLATTQKRLGRKQILEVDVQKACQTIVDPVAPMALRLQGNLMYDAVPHLVRAIDY